MKNKLNYENVTISGLPGAGSSTLGVALSKILGWKYFSGGDFMRNYAIRKGLFDPKNTAHHTATVYSDDFDRQVDFGMRQDLQTKEKQIVDAWLSGFMAQGIQGTLKTLVYCSNDAIRVDRIANRDNITIEEAKNHIFDREKKNINKWKDIYKNQWKKWIIDKKLLPKSKPIWFWYPKLYDLSIDTFTHSKEETLKLALKSLNYSKPVNYNQVFPSD